MFGKVIVFGLFEIIQKKKEKKSADGVLGSRFGLRVGSGTAVQAATHWIELIFPSHSSCLCGTHVGLDLFHSKVSSHKIILHSSPREKLLSNFICMFSLLISFHKPTPKLPIGILVNQPPFST